MDEVLRVLYEARDRVMQRWGQGAYKRKTGEVCALGAIADKSPSYWKAVHTEASEYLFHSGVNQHLGRDGASIGRLLNESKPVVVWNDEKGRTKSDVIEAFDRAIKARERDLEEDPNA